MPESDSSRLVKDMGKNMLTVKYLELAFRKVLEAFLVPDPVERLEKALLQAEGMPEIHEEISNTIKELKKRRPHPDPHPTRSCVKLGEEYLLGLINKGPEAWNKWREENSNEVIDLRPLDLTGRRLRYYNFSHCICRDVRWFDLHLEGVCVVGADFAGAVLSGKWTQVNAEDACFREADLSNMTFAGVCFDNVDFRGADLSNTVWPRWHPGSTMRNVIAHEACFDRSDFNGLREISPYALDSFHGATFDGCTNLSKDRMYIFGEKIAFEVRSHINRREDSKGEDEEPEEESEEEEESDKGYNIGYCPRCCREKVFDYADILKAYTCPYCGAEFLLMDLVLHSIRHKARMEGWENRSACETGEECKMPELMGIVLDDETSEFLEELDSMWVFGEKIVLETRSRIKSFDDIEFVWANKEQPEKPANVCHSDSTRPEVPVLCRRCGKFYFVNTPDDVTSCPHCEVAGNSTLVKEVNSVIFDLDTYRKGYEVIKSEMEALTKRVDELREQIRELQQDVNYLS